MHDGTIRQNCGTSNDDQSTNATLEFGLAYLTQSKESTVVTINKEAIHTMMTEQTDETSGNEVIDISKAENDGNQQMPSVHEVFKGYDDGDLQASMDIEIPDTAV